MFRALLILEAVHSVAIEHPSGCVCTACKAAAGDPTALDRIIAAVAQAEEK